MVVKKSRKSTNSRRRTKGAAADWRRLSRHGGRILLLRRRNDFIILNYELNLIRSWTCNPGITWGPWRLLWEEISWKEVEGYMKCETLHDTHLKKIVTTKSTDHLKIKFESASAIPLLYSALCTSLGRCCGPCTVNPGGKRTWINDKRLGRTGVLHGSKGSPPNIAVGCPNGYVVKYRRTPQTKHKGIFYF